jgi:hypothetical protein
MMVRIHPLPDSSFGLDPDHDSPKSELTRYDKFQCCVVGHSVGQCPQLSISLRAMSANRTPPLLLCPI